jgi:coenzyme F420 hydrogenase subunit beta
MKMSRRGNIQYIVNNALCTGCGGCSGVCPTRAITMQWNAAGYIVARVEINKCNFCGLCSKVCPSVAENQIVQDGDPFHGVSIKAYIGHSTDSEIRQKSQSGGVVTSLLYHLLERRLIEGAIVNRFCKETKSPEVVCVSTKNELLKAAGSYYSQTSVAKTVIEHNDKELAAVVLGCQAESLKLIRKLCPKISAPEYTIGLVCAGQYSRHYIDDLISLSGAANQNVERFRFRDKDAGGWPGNVKVYTTELDYILDKKYRHRLKPLYESYRCLLCFDQMNIYSDIVVGDPWGINNEENEKGNSVIISRTEKGQSLLESALEQGYIKATQLPVGDVFNGQTVDGRLKTQFFNAVNLCKQMDYLLPVARKNFEGVPHVEPSRKQSRMIKDRLEYTLKVHQASSTEQVKKIRGYKKMRLERKQRLNELNNSAKSMVKCMLRFFHLRKG